MQHTDPWIRMLSSERQRRRAETGEEAGKQLLARLEEIAGRLRSAPDFVEPTPEEHAEALRTIEAWFVEHGYVDAD